MALPQQLKSARMSNATVGNTIDTNVGALESALADIFGFTINTDITASPFSLNNSGQITKALVAQRAAGPVGWRLRDTVSSREVRMAVSGTDFVIDENTGSEAVPVWTNRFKMAIATGALTGAVATAAAMGLCPQGDGNVAHFLNGNLGWTTPSVSAIPICRVRNSSTQALSSGTAAALTFNTEDFDTDTMHSTVSNTSRITIVTAGKYYFAAGALFASNAVGYRQLQIKKNAATVYGMRSELANATLAHAMQCNAVIDLVAGDYVEVFAYQNSGGSLNSIVGATYAPFFAAYKVA